MSTQWDPVHCGAHTVISGAGLIAQVNSQELVRTILGRDPAAGGNFQIEIKVPVVSGGNSNLRPQFGMVDAVGDATAAALAFTSVHCWMFGTGASGIANNYIWHNGDLGIDWLLAGGGNGGVPGTYQLVYNATAKTLKIYLTGVLQYTLAGVGADGVLMYFCFGTGSAGTGFSDQGTLNAGLTAFDYPIGGATAWAPPVPPVPDFAGDVVTGIAPLIVRFSNLTTGGLAYAWNFGDADVSTEASPVHAFHEAGTYTVALTATNADGSATATKVAYITVTDAPVVTSDERHPRIGYRCIAFDNDDAVVTADSTASGYAPANAFDWKPYTYWQPAAGGEHYVQVVIPEAEVADYIAIAQHNLGEQAGSFRLAYSNDSGATWSDAFANYSPSARESIWLDFTAVAANYWRVYTTSANPASLGVVAFGRKYRPYRGQYAGFMPPKLARSFSLYASTSEGGLFLGRSILRKKLKGSISFDLMEMDDAYGDWHPFMQAAERHPFFLAWLLEDWPEDVQLVETDGDWTQPAITQFGFIGTTVAYAGLLQE